MIAAVRLVVVVALAVVPPTVWLTLAAAGVLPAGPALLAAVCTLAFSVWAGRAYLLAHAFEALDQHGDDAADPFTASVEAGLRQAHEAHRAEGCTRVTTAAEFEHVARDLDGALHELADLVAHDHAPSTLGAETLMHLRWARNHARRLANAAALREASRC